MISPVKVGHNEILWTKVTVRFTTRLRYPSIRTKILSIQFHALTSASAAGSYSFCHQQSLAILTKVIMRTPSVRGDRRSGAGGCRLFWFAACAPKPAPDSGRAARRPARVAIWAWGAPVSRRHQWA